MSLIIKDKVADGAARELAKLEGKTLTETVRDALTEKLAARRRPLSDQIMEWVEDFNAKYPDKGPQADKAFYDALSGNE